jgi:hypothetical protein
MSNIVLEVTAPGRSHGYRATFHREGQALRFITSRPDHGFAELESEPLAEQYARLIRALYPQCEHGLSAELCGGPMHWYDEANTPGAPADLAGYGDHYHDGF